MFTLTDDACLIVKALAARTAGGRDHGGIRISDGSDRGTTYQLEPVDGPEPGDVVVDQKGARVFLAADVADDLDGAALEASVNEEGIVDFSLGNSEQERPEGMTEVRRTGKSG